MILSQIPPARAIACIFLCLATALGLVCASPPTARAAGRMALVIGNSAYQNVPQLPNPVRDAKAIAAVLRRMGYDVSLKTDLDYDGMRKAFRAFSRRAAGADVAVVFYAGHGMEAGGVNYLIPVDAELKNVSDLEYEAFSLNKALAAVEGARRLKVVMLDACRDNPFARRMKRSAGRTRSIGRGLARVEPEGSGMLVAYAARAGSTADDGDGEHSPFTQALLKNLPTPGLDVRLMFGRVKDEVRRATGGRQEPFIYGSLGGRVVSLAPGDAASPPPASPVTPPPITPAPPAANASGDDSLAYRKAVAAGTMEAYEEFLRKFPGSQHAPQVRKLIAALVDDRAWNRAREKDTIAAYNSYIIAFPEGAYVSQAKRRMARLQEPQDTPGRDETPPPPARQFKIYAGYDLYGGDYARSKNGKWLSQADCVRACTEDPRCNAFTYNEKHGMCFLKDRVASVLKPWKTAISGVLTSLPQPARPTSNGICGPGYDTRPRTDFLGNDIGGYRTSLSGCRAMCDGNANCIAFAWIAKSVSRRCWLKFALSRPSYKSYVTSCVKN